MNLKLHIISFDVPFPPNYGGVIDVYYKLRELHSAGVRVILHCFRDRRVPARELEEFCDEIYYYPRLTGIRKQFSPIPYIVSSRVSDALRNRLLQDDFPILFEGLHSCFLLSDPALRKRNKIYRESNIEHHYYFQLFKATGNLRDKAFFLTESIKLWHYQKILNHADLMLVVSQEDERYLRKKFPGRAIRYLPSFHRNNQINSKPGRGSYVLYHGNLSVPENIRAAFYIIRQIYTDSLPELVIAGLNPPSSLVRLIQSHPNIRLESNPDDTKMFALIRDAQINLMVTSQATGLKLKLLNALFHGRHCLVNQAMLSGTGLEPVCSIASTPQQFRETIPLLFEKEFGPEEITHREEVILENYSNKKNCKRITDLLTL
ncbi:MAG: glycosyltransferase family 1 protein [Bacteroidales bacterium]|nr:glycosyltransferase family 1 protein [Bacteroidales bacterium]